MKRIRTCLVALVVLAGTIMCLLYYISDRTTQVPDFFSTRLKKLLLNEFGIEGYFEDLRINPSSGIITVSSFTLSLPREKPFVQGKSGKFEFAKEKGIFEVLRGDAAFDKISVSEVFVDFTSPLPKGKIGSESVPTVPQIPIKELNLNRLELKNWWGSSEFAPFYFAVKRVAGKSEIDTKIIRNPIGGLGRLQASIDLAGGPTKVNFSFDGITPGDIEKIFPFFLLYGITSKDGTLGFNLTWEGNFLDRFADPAKDIGKFLSRELSGKVQIASWGVSYRGEEFLLDIGAEKPGKNDDWKYNLNGQIGTGSFTIDGKWLGKKDDWLKAVARVKIDDIAIKRSWLEYLKPELSEIEPGIGNVEALLNYENGQWSSEGIGILDDLEIKHIPVRAVKAQWKSLLKDVVATYAVLSDFGEVSGDFAYHPTDSPEDFLSIRGILNNFSFKPLTKFIGFPIEGVCGGPFWFSMGSTGIASASYGMDFEIRNPMIFGVAPRIITGSLSGNGKKWAVENVQTEFPEGGKIDMHGRISHDGFSCRIIMDGIPTRVCGLSTDVAFGSCNFNGVLSGKLSDPHLEGDLWAENLSIFSRFFTSFKARLIVDNKRLILDPMVAALPENANADGFIVLDLRTGEIIETKISFQDIDVSFLEKLEIPIVKKFPPRGKISGLVERHSIGPVMSWNFSFSGNKLNIGSEKIDSISCEGLYLVGQVEVKKLVVNAFGGTVELQGRFPGKGVFSGSVIGRDITLDEISGLKTTIPEIKGNLTLEGNLDWSDKTKNGYLTVFGKGIGIKKQELGNFGAEVIVDSQGLKVVQSAFDQVGVSLSGELDWDGRKPYKARLDMKKTDLSFIAASKGFTGFGKGDLLVDGSCSVSGDIASFVPDFFDAAINHVEIHHGIDLIVSNKPLQVRFQNGIFEIRSLELKYRQGVLGLEGTLDPIGKTALTLAGQDFSLLALGNLLEIPNWAVDGSLSVNGGIIGSFPNFQLSGAVDIEKLTWAGRTIPKLSAKCSVTKEEIQLDSVTIFLPNNKIAVRGKLPFSKFKSRNDMDIIINVASGPINDLPIFIPELFNNASGTMRGEIRLNGCPLSPTVSGDFLVNATELGFKGMKKPFRDVSLGLSTQDGIIKISPLKASLGRGILNGHGEIDFRSGPGSLTADLSGEKLDVSWGGIDIDGAKANISASGNLYNPVIRGKIKIPKGRARISDQIRASNKINMRLPLQSLDYIIDLEIPRNFWLRNSFLNAEMQGKVKLSGDLKTMHLAGEIHSMQGWVNFQRRKFVLETGEIRLGERDGNLDPHIFVKSVTNIQNTQVFLTLEGMLSSFTPRIYSSPPMAEGDLFALLTVGRNLDQARQTNTRDLFENEILEGLKNTYLTGLLGSTLSSALNLDELFLGSLFDRDTGITRSFLRVGKYVGNNVFIAYEGTLSNEDKKTYIVEYRLPKGFLLNVEVEKPINRTTIGVKYDWKF